MILSTVDLSRAQFAFTVAFHIIFPAFSIGLASFLMVMEACYLATKKPIYYQICKFWMKIFALTFGMGVVSGLVMEVQIGTNWSVFSREAGGVLGSLFTYEVMTAFFIEAGFLGVMLFGWKKVGPKLHFLATLLVWLGVTVSAFWILSANSWMQTPSGATIDKGRFIVNNWHDVVFNPSTLVRLGHMLLAAYLTSAFAIMSICAYYILNKQYTEFAKKCFSFALWVITILAPLQIFIGDTVGLKIHQYQPIKTAAIEANWETQKGAPLILFAYPDQELQRNRYAIKIPKLASLINTHEIDGVLQGLKSVSPKDQPWVPAVFYSFRIMVAIGIIMLLIGLFSLLLRWQKKLYTTHWFLRCCEWFAPFGFIAIITGWITAEAGRQPWVIYGLLRTVDAASPVSPIKVFITLALTIFVYFIIFGVFYFRYLFKIIAEGPSEISADTQPFSYMNDPTMKEL